MWHRSPTTATMRKLRQTLVREATKAVSHFERGENAEMRVTYKQSFGKGNETGLRHAMRFLDDYEPCVTYNRHHDETDRWLIIELSMEESVTEKQAIDRAQEDYLVYLQQHKNDEEEIWESEDQDVHSN